MTASIFNIAKVGAQRVATTFTAHDDDWAPVLLIRNRAGAVHATTITIDPNKDLTATAITRYCRARGATEAALILSAWTATIPPTPALPPIRPSEHPNRRETLVICAAGGHNGNATALADITRHDGQPPTLGPFKDISNVTGRFNDALTLGVAMGSGG